MDAPLPSSCPHCGSDDVEHVRDTDQFKTDLPALPPPSTTRFKVGIGRCRACGKRVQGRHAEQTSDALGAAGAQIGPNAKAWAAWMHYSLGIPFEKISRFFADRLGLRVTAGALCQASQTTSTALVPVTTDIRKRINDSPVVVMDETGWRVNAQSAWVWIATTPDYTAYNVGGTRSFDDAIVLVNADYTGTIVHDGWIVYDQYTNASHQTCLAHLCRRADELIVSVPAGHRSTPRYVRQLLGEALDARNDDPTERQRVIADVTERIELLAEQAHPNDENRKLVNHLHRNLAGLFTFLTDPTVDATSLARRARNTANDRDPQSVRRQPHRPRSNHPRPDDDDVPHRHPARHRRRRLPRQTRTSTRPHHHHLLHLKPSDRPTPKPKSHNRAPLSEDQWLSDRDGT